MVFQDNWVIILECWNLESKTINLMNEASNIGILEYCPSTGQTGDIDISVKIHSKNDKCRISNKKCKSFCKSYLTLLFIICYSKF